MVLSTLSGSWHAKRVSEIWNIAKSLEAKLMSDWMIPVPDEKVEIKVNGATVYYQWIAWKDVLNKLNIWQEAKDPLDWVWYTYTTTNNLRRYQVFWYLEKWKIWYTKWNRLWVIVDAENWNPIHFKKSWVDLKQTSDNFIVYVDNTSSWKIEWNWEEILKNIWKFIVWNYYNTCKQILENNNYIQWIDWKYIIKTKAKTNLEVFCDMTNDWGGWTLVAFNKSNSSQVFDKNFMIKEVNPLRISDKEIVNFLSSINPEWFSKELKTQDVMLISRAYSATPIIENWNWIWDYDKPDCEWKLWHTARNIWCSNHSWNDNYNSHDRFNIAIYQLWTTSIVPYYSELCWSGRWNCDFEFYLR